MEKHELQGTDTKGYLPNVNNGDDSLGGMNVLVTNGNYLHTLGVVRSLGQAGATVYCLAPTTNSIALHSRYCAGGFIGPPDTDGEAYVAFLERVLTENSFDLLMPIGALATRIVSQHRERFAGLIHFEIAEHQAFETAYSKRQTYALAEKVGVPYPKTVYPQSLDEVEQLAREFQYPVVIKAILEEGANVVRYPKNREELLAQYRLLCQERGYVAPLLPMLQEFIYSDDIGYSFCALYQKGTCKRVFMYRELRSYPIRGGSSTYAESYYGEDLKTFGTALLDALEWNGVAHMDFRRDAQGRLRLMEINPKFWASLELALAAGIDFPALLCQMANGRQLDVSDDYQVGIRYHWPLSKELRHVAQNPKSLPKVLGSCLDPRTKSNLWLSDLKPSVVEFVSTVQSFWRHRPWSRRP
jgi:predicted ATP-grasp superfamily ATP-dependent carboligase